MVGQPQWEKWLKCIWGSVMLIFQFAECSKIANPPPSIGVLGNIMYTMWGLFFGLYKDIHTHMRGKWLELAVETALNECGERIQLPMSHLPYHPQNSHKRWYYHVFTYIRPPFLNTQFLQFAIVVLYRTERHKRTSQCLLSIYGYTRHNTQKCRFGMIWV